MNFEPGWLRKEMERTADSLRATHHPGTLRHLGVKEETPIPQADAARLFDILAARFQAWTGQDIQKFNRLQINSEK